MADSNDYTGSEIAVIGMAVKFPGAGHIDEFWNNLKKGIDAVIFFSENELIDAGVDKNMVTNPHYVKANISIQEKEYFDASFFGYIPEEAQVMNPQTRIFHECVWHALEDAGYTPALFRGIIGLFAGAGEDFEWQAYSMIAGVGKSLDNFTSLFLRSKDSLSTRISYKLDLQGPSVSVNTACSTSLVAIHIACRSLLSGECDIALAGGVTIINSSTQGYHYQEGMILSPDGHCRAFDARARGTLIGEGAGAVVLKPLDSALRDGDNIYAVVKGSAINNDGGVHKVGYTAPGVKGQAKAIRNALSDADVPYDSITYIETHGTGTTLGDPIEISALNYVFGENKTKYCALGSVKTNIGHTDTAAGAAGFIKTVLALKHRQIPPSLHFQEPNPQIEFTNSPFYVNTELQEWRNDRYPLRAGVSSFGIGGTNAHVILEEAPTQESSSTRREYQLLMLSAKSAAALDRMTGNLKTYFERNKNINLADAAFTLQVGRGKFSYRRMFACKDIQSAVKILSSPGSSKIKTFKTKKEEKLIVFMFPGQGSQYVNMGLGLYCSEPLFRKEVDHCAALFASLMGFDLRPILYPGEGKIELYPENKKAKLYPVEKETGFYSGDKGAETTQKIDQTALAQPIIFTFEYALANLIMAWGIKPDYMIGYSYGEYVAACLSGVISLTDVIKLVALRGQLTMKLPEGAMLSVPLPPGELLPLLNEELSLAVDNGSSCIAAGSTGAVDAFEKKMKDRGLLCMKVKIAHAAHSDMMSPILEEFERNVQQIKLNQPLISYISCTSGTWITAKEAVDPKYWSAHLRSTVRFSQGLDVLLEKKELIFVEIGAGKALSNLVRQKIGSQTDRLVINLVRNKEEDVSDLYYLLERMGRLWLYGQKIDWKRFYTNEKRKRISLPTYSFEKTLCPVGESLTKVLSRRSTLPLSTRNADISDWFYLPSWKKSIIPPKEKLSSVNACNLIFMDNCGLGSALLAKFSEKSEITLDVSIGNEYSELSGFSFIINPDSEEDFMKLFKQVVSRGLIPGRIIHLWSITGNDVELLTADRVREAQRLGYYSLLNIARAVGFQKIRDRIDLLVVSNNMFDVNNVDMVDPGKSTILGAVNVIPLEYINISCRCIDILLPGKENITGKDMITQLYDELCYQSSDTMIAYRNLTRWVQTFDKIKLPGGNGSYPSFKEKGVYLITGGLGGMGLTFSSYLGRNYKARLILTGRSDFPARIAWQEWVTKHAADNEVSKKILILKDLENTGAEILYLQVDVADRELMEEKIKEAEKYFGPINGIIHTAGMIDYAGVIHNRSKEKNEAIFSPKICGTLVLNDIFQNKKLDFFVLCSSISAIIASFGEVGYAAANAFLDAFARYRMLKERLLTISINWSIWNEVGMGYRALLEKNPGKPGSEIVNSIHPQEGVEVLLRIIEYGIPRLAVSIVDVNSILSSQKQANRSLEEFDNKCKEAGVERPELLTAYMAPSTTAEKALVELWQSFFGIEKIGINDDFFELGGDSLKAMNISGRIFRELNIDIPFVELFNRPTIKKLAEFIEASEENEFAAVRNVEKKEYYTLTSAQKRLFILQQIDLLNMNYNESRLIYLEGEIDKDRVAKIVDVLLRRHESLRTSFVMMKQEPVQKIDLEVHLSLAYAERGSLISGSPARKLEEKMMNVFRPFDLSNAPLLRVMLIKTVEKKYILLFYHHHIIADGISQLILEREFMSMYHGEELPALRLQYRDFAAWENSGKQQELFRQNAEYWINKFSGEILALNLPLDYPRPIMQSFEGSAATSVLNEKQTGSLKKIAKENETTLYMSLLAIFNLLVSKLSGQEEIIVGTPTAGRRHIDIASVIGMFVNTLPLRNYPTSELTFTEFLADVKKCVLEAFENQGYRFEDLVDRAAVRRDTSRNPIFDVMFNLMDKGEYSVDISDNNKAIDYRHRKSTSKFDLNVTAVDFDKIIYIDFEYCTKLFKPVTIERIIGYFKSILNTVISNPAIKLGDIEIISDTEKNQILQEFNNTKSDYPGNKKIHELISEQVERTPDNTALVGMSQVGWSLEQVSYKKLEERIDRLASWLREKGSGRDVIVGIMPERSLEMMVGILGILKSGGAYLPIDTGLPQVRTRYMIKDSGTEFLLTQGDFLDVYRDICETVNLYDGDIYDVMRDNISNRNISSDLAYVTYTSGSTGKPKGVMIRHMSVVNFIKGITDVIEFKDRDVILSLTTICFDIFGLETLLPLTKGTRVVIGSREEQLNPGEACNALLRSGISIFQVTPSRLSLLIEHKESTKVLKVLSYLLVGGEAFPVTLLEKVREIVGCRIFNLYGPTETTIWSTLKDVSGEEILNIGKPICNTGIYIVDSQGRLQPIGIKGELGIAGDGLAVGYLNRLELTEEKFITQVTGVGDRCRWERESFCGSSLGGFLETSPLVTEGERIYKTGDMARWLLDGNIEFLGRVDHQVKLRGFRVELEEIERLLTGHDEIREALVLLKGDRSGGDYLCAYIVCAEDGRGTSSNLDLREYLSRYLPDYMIPSYFVQVDKIPLTANGKIDRKILPDPELEATDEYIAPGNDIEEKLVEIWAEVLAVDKDLIGINTNFFELGGNSLRIINVYNLIKERFNYDITIAFMFRLPTIKALANHLIGEDIKVQVSDGIIEESLNTIKETFSILSEDNP